MPISKISRSLVRRPFLAALALVASAALGACAAPGAEDGSLGTHEEELSADVTVTDGTLACDAATSVEVSISGANITNVTPADLMLVVDESGSINAQDFERQRQFLLAMIDSLAQLFDNGGKVGISAFSSGGQSTGILGGSSRIIAPLSGDSVDLKNRVSAMVQAKGYTCIGCGLQDAATQFAAPDPNRRRLVVVFTDGANNATRAPAASPEADLRAKVVALAAFRAETFAVGVGPAVQMSELQLISRYEPNHVFAVNQYNGLNAILQSLVAAVVLPEATDAELVLDVNDAFSITSASTDVGTARIAGNRISWTIPKILDETVTLRYQVRHIFGTHGGTKPMHESVSYSDAEGNDLSVPEIAVTIVGCDQDEDGVVDELDNCLSVPNPDQGDLDTDGAGDLCDADDDDDGIEDAADNCERTSNADQADFDGDGQGDACDADDDGDGVGDGADACEQTEAREKVGADGCALEQLCACDADWADHGEYVDCITNASRDLEREGVLTHAERTAEVKTAAKSTCGK